MNGVLSFYLFIKVNVFEVFGEELAHDAVVSVVLGEIFDDFFAFLYFILRVKTHHLL